MSVTKGQQQARRVFAKYCQDIDHALGGYAISGEDGKQYIGNSFCVVRYTEAVTNNDIVRASVNCTKTFKKFIDEAAAEWKDIVSVDDIKLVEGDKNLLQISGKLYNAKALNKPRGRRNQIRRLFDYVFSTVTSGYRAEAMCIFCTVHNV